MTCEAKWTPEQLGKLTLTQLACLSSDKDPGGEPVFDSAAKLYAAIEEKHEEEREWYALPED